MIAVSLQRFMNTTTSLGFNFLSIEQSVLEGTVGKSNLVLTYWVGIWLLSEWRHWLLASVEESCLMAGAFLWDAGLWHLYARVLVIPVCSTLTAEELLCKGDFHSSNGESKLPHCLWRGLTKLLSGICLAGTPWAPWVLAVDGISGKSECSHFRVLSPPPYFFPLLFLFLLLPSLLLVCCPQWDVVCSDEQFAAEVSYIFPLLSCLCLHHFAFLQKHPFITAEA